MLLNVCYLLGRFVSFAINVIKVEDAYQDYSGENHMGPSIKYVRKNLPIFDPPPLPPCTQCVRIGLDPPPPSPPCTHVRNFHGYIESII